MIKYYKVNGYFLMVHTMKENLKIINQMVRGLGIYKMEVNYQDSINKQ
jgi:hypothetical protein